MTKLLSMAKSNAVCPYCKDRFSTPKQIVCCSQCRTLHHRQCWADYRHCSVFGCSGLLADLDQTALDAHTRRQILATLGVLLGIGGPVAVIFLLLEHFSPGAQALLGVLILFAGVALAVWSISRASACPACGSTKVVNAGDNYESCSQCGMRFIHPLNNLLASQNDHRKESN